ncbi:Gibberellin 3-beta-dioxygenase 3 [Morus notabilis]|uniref:gibberellin 3beta-dioxygenase n=1 Tax=Morus notabilis TaxID=981085 RepID=W9RXI8_9ROSA|nr:gibberellin 3-beta-dioxygenase 3 [Morus notabilis]EXB76252.1 Gibberellin 3-beta-dioxygenase 3 [Morus notabilis]
MKSLNSEISLKIANPINPTNIVPLDFNSVPTLPDSHTWTPCTSADPSFTGDDHSVPVIDLFDPNAVSLIRQACERWGAFQVTNHGVPYDHLKEVESQSRRFFALPAERKLRVVRSAESVTGYGLVPISKFFPKMMWSEGFSMTGSPEEYARQLWPHEDCRQFCSVMEMYQKEMKGLSEKLLELILRSLGVNYEDIKWANPKNGLSSYQALLQLNSYPVCPDPTRAMGLAPHTDSSLLTVLYQSCMGLQVQRKEDIGWVPVHTVDGALIVNLGDLMHIMSNGRFKSAMHRAVVNKTHHRVSVAYFCGPPKEEKISSLIQMIDDDRPRMYRGVTWKEYLEIRAAHFDKALEFIKNNNIDDA